MTYDHLGFNVRDFAASYAFYEKALAPFGLKNVASGEGWATFGAEGRTELWIGAFGPTASPIHVAFSAQSPEIVDAFYQAALAAGGTDNGAPGPRPQYGPHYYAAFVKDPDGHNIEAVCRAA